MRDAVAITGLGVISAAGADVTSSLRTLRSAVRPVMASCPVATLPTALPMFAVMEDTPAADRTFHLAMTAIRQALDDAGLSPLPRGFRLGVCLGTTVACQLNNLAFYREYRATGNPPMDAAPSDDARRKRLQNPPPQAIRSGRAALHTPPVPVLPRPPRRPG